MWYVVRAVMCTPTVEYQTFFLFLGSFVLGRYTSRKNNAGCVRGGVFSARVREFRYWIGVEVPCFVK